MTNWQKELTSRRESLVKVNIRKGIFKSDSLSPFLFMICMTLITHVQCKAKARYTLGGEKINQLPFMDNSKQHGKSKSEIKELVSPVEVFSQNISIDSDFKK